MLLALLLSSIAAGILATAVMLVVHHLPRLWNSHVLDIFDAVGSVVVREEDRRRDGIGALVFFAGGVGFALLYGWLALALLRAPAGVVPQWTVLPTFPVEINLIYPFIGYIVGHIHGIMMGFLFMEVVIEHHPVEHYHSRYQLVFAQLFGHIAYAITVMFLHHLFLQLLLDVRA